MKKVLLITSVLCGFAILTGCQSNYINQPTSLLNIKAEARVEPIISVGEKIEGSAAVSRTFFVFVHGPGKFAEGVNYGNNSYKDQSVSTSIFTDTVVMAKAAAAYRACAENKADFIICPRYVISVSDYFFYKEVIAKVTGYKGVLRDIKMPEDKPKEKGFQIEKQLKEITDDIDGIKDSTADLASTKKLEYQDDLQKDVKKKDMNPDTDMKLNSKINFNK
jgi:hypothetical protein